MLHPLYRGTSLLVTFSHMSNDMLIPLSVLLDDGGTC